MLVLVTYDVNTQDKLGRKRLRHVAKICVNYGQRVQHSVFECSVTPAEFVNMKAQLSEIIDDNLDSLRFYLLGKSWQNRVEQIGKNDTYDPDKGVLML